MCRDTDQFLELLKPHYSDALNYCRALCSNSSAVEAEDVLQQSLLQALENIEKLKDIRKFRSWLFTIITRVFYSYMRKNFWKKFVSFDNYANLPEIPVVFDRAEQNEKRQILFKALSKLKYKERTAILLFEIAEFSIEEIKDIQKEKSLSAIKSRLSRTRTKLRNIITELENGDDKKIYFSSKHFIGDIEDETLKLVPEIKTKSDTYG